MWPVWIGGAVLGATNAVYALLSSQLMGAWGPWRNLAAWLEQAMFSTHLLAKAGFSPDLTIGVIAISMVAGSFVASIAGREFFVRKSNRSVLIRGFFGGILIAFGASVAQGCTVFHLMGGIPSLLLGSFIFFAGVYLGIYWGVKMMTRLISKGL